MERDLALQDTVGEQAPRAAAPDEDAVPPSSRLGRFYVLHRLGMGGMGIVYVGYDESLDRRVALKVLRRGAIAREWLLREGQALGRLSHPNVVAVHEVGEHAGRVFLAMELVEGPTLRAFLEERPRPFAEILRLFLQAGRGLWAAHQAGLVHRDFKPDNVLIGPDGRARVVDFGLAALAGGEGAPAEPALAGGLDGDPGALHTPLTQTGALVGTPAYMSPEQLRGERATALCDQWSFCVALYRSAYGAPPHPAAGLLQLAQAVQEQPAAAPPQRAEVPAWLWPILSRGLERDPAQRFPSMGELLQALTRHVPRDPQMDPAVVVRERVVLTATFVASYVLAAGLMLSRACAEVLMRPRWLIAVPALLIGVMLLAIAWGWRGLSRSRYGRRLARMFPGLLLAVLGQRLIGLRLHTPAEHILIGDAVLLAAMYGMIALMEERWILWLSGCCAVGATVGALWPAWMPRVMGLIGVMNILIIGVRVYLDRHITPAPLMEVERDPDGAVD